MNEKFTKETVLEQLMERAAKTVAKVKELKAKSGSCLHEWFDNQDVCMLLGISPRTLQYYRSRGMIGYSMVGHKVYYSAEEVKALLLKKTISNKKHK